MIWYTVIIIKRGIAMKERTFTLGELQRKSLTAANIEVVPQHWQDGRVYLNYAHMPRPRRSLFFICTDITAVFETEDGKTWVGRQGDVFYLPRSVRYTVRFNREEETSATDTYVLDFDLFDKDGTPVGLGPEILLFHTQAKHMDYSALDKIAVACHDVVQSQFYILSLFFGVLHSLCTSVTTDDNGFYALRRGVELLRQEWDKNEKISRYAQACGISESYFRMLFRQWAGMGPIEYRNRLRISHAKAYLLNSPMLVEEVSALVGFEDMFYFSRLFKKLTGTSPREYRKL